MIFKRKLYERMLQWKQDRNGTTALLIQGARRVGKSTLATQFAQQEYKSFILLDFAESSTEIDELFDNVRDLDYFFFRLQNLFHTTLYKRESVIIFDEIQLKPLARQAIKYLVRDGRYDYIETGSLLSIKKNVQHIVIPSEETRLTLYPMDFEEFRWALSDENTVPFMEQAFSMKRPMGQSVHRQWMRDIRVYALVGGMPQAVQTYLSTNDLQQVDAVKREIIQLYDDDFHKIDGSGTASRLFMDIPTQLTSNANRYMVYSATERRLNAATKAIIREMQDSKVIHIAYHANDPQVGMPLSRDTDRYKIFLADTGLFLTLAFWDKDYTENIIYQQLLSDKLSVNLGYVYENLVAQMLQTKGDELFYYTFPSENNHNYEIDFLLSRGNKLVPIEVKSSGYKTHKSLDVFCGKYSSRIGERILLYAKDYASDGETVCVPVYFTPFL